MATRHGFDRAALLRTFAKVEPLPSVLEAIARPPRARPWLEYRDGFVNARRIDEGVAFWARHEAALQRAEQQYGVPQAVIVALLGVETHYGRVTGRYRVFDALTHLAFDYPRRAEFFRSELEQFLLLAREQGYDLRTPRGSYAGAIGIPQFMPSSYRRYAVDFNGDGRTDLEGAAEDAIGSVGHYLKVHGWQAGAAVALPARLADPECAGETAQARPLAAWAQMGIVAEGATGLPPDTAARLLDYTLPEGKEFWLGLPNFEAITQYNHSDYYAMAVYQLSEALLAARGS